MFSSAWALHKASLSYRAAFSTDRCGFVDWPLRLRRPDVRRDYAPPSECTLTMGLCPWFGLRPLQLWARGRTRGAALQEICRVRRGIASPHIRRRSRFGSTVLRTVYFVYKRAATFVQENVRLLLCKAIQNRRSTGFSAKSASDVWRKYMSVVELLTLEGRAHNSVYDTLAAVRI